MAKKIAAESMVVTRVQRASADVVRGSARPHLRVWATISGREYEFTKLDAGSLFEVYDRPKSWGGLPRFLGYAPAEAGSKLLSIVGRQAVSS